MQIIGASCVFLCNQKFSILHHGGVIVSEEGVIIEVGDFQSLQSKFPNTPYCFHQDCVLLPALSNAHIHFEFSNNQSKLIYGDFGDWLKSVLDRRDELFENLTQSIQKEIQYQIQGGVASVGAISSYGYDMALLANSPLRVTFFNEAIGNNAEALDVLFGHFKERLQESQRLKSSKFRPALAIHSPYSTHFVLAKKVAQIAKDEHLKLSCHFLESSQEAQWLNEQSGWFKEFFASFFGNTNTQPSMNAEEFLALLSDLSPLMVHCLFADSPLLDQISQMQGFIISAPRSNRLLNQTYLDLKRLKQSGLSPIFATDGLSSNFSLSLIEEIRYAFFAYPHLNVIQLAQDLILGITYLPALALGNHNGELTPSKLADLAVFECQGIEESTQKELHFVLHAQKTAKELYIQGEKVWKK